MRALLATVGLLAIVGSAAAQSLASSASRTATGTPIDALAQDGNLIAWLAPGGLKCNVIHIVGGTEPASAPDPASSSMTCGWDLSDSPAQLAIAADASTVLWTLHEDGSTHSDWIMSARFNEPERHVDRLTHADDGTGDWLGSVAGSGTTLAYSFVDVEYVDAISCLSGGSCKRQISGGGINVVTDIGAQPLPNAAPALQLATAAGRIAYVPASWIRKSGKPSAGSSANVQVVDATDGSPVSSVQPRGVPLAIALSPNVLTVLTRDGHRDWISWYDATAGTTLGSIRVSSRSAQQLAASDRLAVYQVGTTLQGLWFGPGRVRKLATISGTPVGLSLDNSRLAWAQNSSSSGKIRTLAVGNAP